MSSCLPPGGLRKDLPIFGGAASKQVGTQIAMMVLVFSLCTRVIFEQPVRLKLRYYLSHFLYQLRRSGVVLGNLPGMTTNEVRLADVNDAAMGARI